MANVRTSMAVTFTIFCATLISLFINIHLSWADIKLNNAFLQELKDSGMRFDAPQNEYDSVPVHGNKDMNYELAIRSKSYNMEIRYAIRPPMPSEAMVGPFALFSTVAANIKKNGDPVNLDYTEFKQTDVQTEFNADWGATAMFPAKPSFASPFDFCNIVNIHKKGRGSAFIMYMFNREDAEKVLPEIVKARTFYALRFK